MTRISSDTLRSRLERTTSHHIACDVREDHLTVILSALDPPLRSAQAAPRRSIRRWVTAVAASAAIMSPVGVAMAAEPAVPGDLLYPVKLVSESVRSLVDPGVVARHRLEEAEVLAQRGADPAAVADAVSEAREAVDSSDDPELRDDLRAFEGSDPGWATDDATVDGDESPEAGTAASDDVETVEPSEAVEPAEPSEEPESVETAEVAESDSADSELAGPVTTSDSEPAESESESESTASDD